MTSEHDGASGILEGSLDVQFARVIELADRPQDLADWLTVGLRHRTGATAVVCVECHGPTEDHQVIGVCPRALAMRVSGPEAQALYRLAHRFGSTLSAHTLADVSVRQWVEAQGFSPFRCMPLKAGAHSAGTVLLLGLPPQAIPTVSESTELLLSVAGLVLRNAVLYRRQEETIQLRTRDVMRANEALNENASRIRTLLGDSERARRALLGVLEDQHQASAEVRRLKNHLSSIINSMPSVLVGLNPDGTVSQWNREAEAATGIPASAALNRPVTTLLPEFAARIETLRAEKPGRKPTTAERVSVERGGERYLFDLMLYPLVAEGIDGAVLRIEDVTERTRVQELLIQTEKMMSVGGLAAGMAHEINNPLGIITQAVENIWRRLTADLPANRRAATDAGTTLDAIRAYQNARAIPDFVRDIREAAGRAAQIVANLLEFSRRSDQGTSSTDIARLLERSLQLATSDLDLKKRCDIRSMTVVREFDPSTPPVPVAVVELEQVFLNVITNAAHALAERRDAVERRMVLRVHPEGSYVVAQVEDNGPGMTADARGRAFEPFFTTKPPGLGTGLGLSVAYMIVTQHHKGLMEIESTPGEGSCVTVRLPLASSDDDVPREAGTVSVRLT